MAKKTACGAMGWMLATALAGWAAGPAQAADCLAAPAAAAPAGRHWYYRLDRANNRQCWYLRQSGLPTRAAAPPKTRQAESRAAERPARPASLSSRGSHEALFEEFLEWRKRQPAPE
jgi:hypothetical protein